MVSIPPDVLNNVKKYIRELEHRGFTSSDAYVFGSYASGAWNEWSDIDVAIISEQFEGIRFLDKEKLCGIQPEYRFANLSTSFFPGKFSSEHSLC